MLFRNIVITEYLTIIMLCYQVFLTKTVLSIMQKVLADWLRYLWLMLKQVWKLSQTFVILKPFIPPKNYESTICHSITHPWRQIVLSGGSQKGKFTRMKVQICSCKLTCFHFLTQLSAPRSQRMSITWTSFVINFLLCMYCMHSQE